uniref:ARAD1C17556p n=1 Tax=Blastobotrys adeninivorans TaxID=409370 RepID=A0A060T665_BLAAD
MESTSTTDLLSGGLLSIHIPKNAPSIDSEVAASLAEVPDRDILFYDEVVTVFVTLKIDKDDEKAREFRKLVDMIALAVEMKVTGSVPQSLGIQGAQTHHSNEMATFVTFSGIISKDSLVQKEDDSAVWKFPLTIVHPRTRLINPQILLDAVVNVSEPPPGDGDSDADGRAKDDYNAYAEPFKPAMEINLFNALDYDKQLYRRNEPGSTKHSRVSGGSGSGSGGGISSSGSGTGSTAMTSSLSASRVLKSEKVYETPEMRAGEFPSRSATPAVNLSAQAGSTPQANGGAEGIAKLSSEKKIAVSPPLNLRLRCSKAAGMYDSIIAVLEALSSESQKVNVRLTSAKIDLPGGSAVLLGGCVEFPLTLTPGESLTLSYKLNHSDVFLLSREQQGNRIKPICITVECIPLVDEGETGPTVTTRWNTMVDFDLANSQPGPPPHQVGTVPGASHSNMLPPTTPGPSAAGGGSQQGTGLPNYNTQPGGPSSSSTSLAQGPQFRRMPKLGRTSSSTSLQSSARVKTSTGIGGLTISFSGPSTVQVGQTFQWKIFAVNKSQVQRNLSLYVHPPDKLDRQVPKNADIYPIVDRQHLRKLRLISQSSSTPGLVCLGNDIRLGPLHPWACCETEITLVALSSGIHTLEGLSVLDHTNGDSYDCGRLLEVVVNNKAS